MAGWILIGCQSLNHLSASILSESLLIQIILFLYFKIYILYIHFNISIFIEQKYFYFFKIAENSTDYAKVIVLNKYHY